MVKGRTGGSMGGRLVPVGPRPYELNEKLCSECAALKGTPCIRASWETRTGSRPETHRSWAERIWVEFPFTDEFVAKQRARNRRPSPKKKKKKRSR